MKFEAEQEARLMRVEAVRLERCSGAACRPRDATGRSYEGSGLLCTAETLSVGRECPVCAAKPKPDENGQGRLF